MRRFPKSPAVQRACCLTVRNLVGRCPELLDPLLGENMEELLRAAGKVPGSVDAAYAALRDLKLEATMVTMNADGQIQVPLPSPETAVEGPIPIAHHPKAITTTATRTTKVRSPPNAVPRISGGRGGVRCAQVRVQPGVR